MLPLILFFTKISLKLEKMCFFFLLLKKVLFFKLAVQQHCMVLGFLQIGRKTAKHCTGG